jgi:hypothetical protein
MILHSRFVLFTLALLLIIAACDSSENPNLLNPPPPDSTLVRVVNLVSGEPVDAVLGGYPLAIQLAPFSVGEFRSFLFNDRVSFQAVRPSRRDTLAGELLAAGSRVSYLVLGSPSGGTTVVKATTGNIDETDLTERGVARVVFINAIPDSGVLYQVRRGCASGDTLFNSIAFGASFPQEVTASSLSLFLFGSHDSLVPAATARIGVTPGRVTYLIAARDNGQIRLFTLTSSAGDLPGALPPAPAETRTEATVEVLNAVSGGGDISVAMQSGGTIANALSPLDISTAATVQACSDPRGDSVVITSNGQPTSAPLRLSVGSRTLVAAYGDQNSPRVVALARDAPQAPAGKVYLRGLNVSSVIEHATITVGAGAPATVAEGSRLFGTMNTGTASGYAQLPEGDYPLILRNAESGGFVMAGVENFASGYYTILVVDRAGVPEMVFLRDDIPATSLDALDAPGTLATFFNMMPDLPASFSVGPLTIDSVGYSYTTSTVLPLGVTSISSNAGQTTIDPASGGYIIGATGTGGSHALIAFNSPDGTPTGAMTGIRFLNAVPEISELALFINTVKDAPDATLPYGQPTTQISLDARKYSFIVRRPGDTTTVARLDGVELVASRSYVLVVGPGTSDSTGLGTLLMQE